MATRQAADQLIVIVGPTASGKSDAAMQLAIQFNGEIICADSRTVYRELDVGTAKPSAQDQLAVPHHLVDIKAPSERFSAAEFQQLANKAIANIQERGKMPILVGGTGLFIDSILFSYQFGSAPHPQLRAELEKKTIEELQNYCILHSIELPKNVLNKRHLVRVIEQKGVNKQRSLSIRPDTFVVGISPEKDILKQRIARRSETIVTQATINEATKVAQKYGWEAPGLSGNIYPIIRRFVNGEIGLHEAKELFIIADWQLARRQMTWFKRNPFIQWASSTDEAVQLIAKHLASLQ